MRKSELSTFPPSSPSPDGSHGKTKPCPKNVTWKPHRKGLKKQMNFCRDQMKCEVTLRDRSGEEGSVCEQRRPCPQLRVFDVSLSCTSIAHNLSA